MAGEDKRNQMMQNLFGDQSEEEEEEEVESEHESNHEPSNASEEGDEGQEPEGEGEIEVQGEADIESEDEPKDADHDHGESEGEREQSSQEVEVADQREESEEKESASDEKAEYIPRDVTSRRRDTVNSGSERSEENNYADNEDEEVNESRTLRSPSQEEDQAHLLQSAPELRNVFGDSDDEEQLEYRVENQIEEESNIHRSPVEKEESYDRELRPEDMLADEEGHYGSEEEEAETKTKERPVGPPLELEIPLRPPPALPEKMHMIKVSNIMGIDSKPFDPKTYVEEAHFETDESGSKTRIRLGNNIVRWRRVRNPDGSTSIESNARFVRWSDGSIQLLIGNEVLDVSEQDAQHDQAHLFLRHGKGILQSQGRILKKMRVMPSSLSSNSHRLLTALVESRHRKGYRVKNCITDIDPEREKEQKERAENQNIRANELLNRKKEKVSRKYTQPVHERRQLSPGFLEDALEEEDEVVYDESRRSDDDLEMMEARAEKLIKAKKGHKDIGRKSSSVPLKSSRQQVHESEKEESEYETEGEEDEVPQTRGRDEGIETDWEEEEARESDEEEAKEVSEEESEVPKKKRKESSSSYKRNELESDEDSPPRKAVAPRRRL